MVDGHNTQSSLPPPSDSIHSSLLRRKKASGRLKAKGRSLQPQEGQAGPCAERWGRREGRQLPAHLPWYQKAQPEEGV